MSVTQGDRQNFNWRPNDNSSTTLARYSQEAEHWTNAFRSAALKKPIGDFSSVKSFFGIIGLVLQLVINLVWLLFYGLGSLFVWLFRSEGNKKFDMPLPPSSNIPSNDEITNMYKDAKEVNLYE